MTSDRLRQAASLLRERAEAATPGRWAHCFTASNHHWVEGPGDYNGYDETLATGTSPDDARYIATMSPPVALALADLLDDTASHVQHAEDSGHVPSDWLDSFPHEFALADAILATSP